MTDPEFIKYTLELCLGLSDDKEFKKEIRKASHKKRIKFLRDHGFTLCKTTYKNS